MLTQENIDDLERVQKCALKIIFEEKYKEYKKALDKIDLETLAERRKALCLSFAQKNVKNVKLSRHFRKNEKSHEMKTREPEEFEVTFSNTERLKKSPIIYMQKLLNQ